MKFCWAVSEELCRQEKQDWLTDGPVKNIIPPQFVAWGIIILIPKIKKGVTPRKKIESKFFCGYAHLQIMSFITTKFHEILSSGFRGDVLTNCFE